MRKDVQRMHKLFVEKKTEEAEAFEKRKQQNYEEMMKDAAFADLLNNIEAAAREGELFYRSDRIINPIPYGSPGLVSILGGSPMSLAKAQIRLDNILEALHFLGFSTSLLRDPDMSFDNILRISGWDQELEKDN